MTPWLAGFIAGIFTGGTLGFFAMALLSMAKKEEGEA